MTANRMPAGLGSGGGRGAGQRAAGNPSLAHSTANGAGGQTCTSRPKPSGGYFLYLGGRRVASVDRDLVLRRTLQGSKHLYTGHGAESWSFHVPVILEAQRLGARLIEVRDSETGIVYRVAFGTFTRRARAVTNRWGSQLALPFGFWQVIDANQPEAEQLGLFGSGL